MSTRTVYIKTALLGGTTDAVDGIDGDTLLDGDVCHAFVSNVLYAYLLDDDSGAAESSPDILAPDSNPGDKRWILQTCAHISDDAYAAGWDGDTTHAPSKNAVYDKIEAMISDDAYAAGWDGDTTHAPSKNAVYDALLQTILTTAGDMPYASAANVVARLAKGNPNEKLFMHASNDAPEWDTGIKVLSFTRNLTAAMGDVSYSGFGFKPSALIVFGTAPSQEYYNSFGLGDTSHAMCYVRFNPAGGPYWTNRSSLIWVGPTNTDYQHANISSMESDGVKLSWTKVGSPTGTYSFTIMAFR